MGVRFVSENFKNGGILMVFWHMFSCSEKFESFWCVLAVFKKISVLLVLSAVLGPLDLPNLLFEGWNTGDLHH